MEINKIQEEIIDEFFIFDDWWGKYEHIIELGNELPLIDMRFKDEDHLIKGCQSKVWLHAELENGLVVFTADSDAVITKGIISLLVRILSHQRPEDIAYADLYFIDEIGLKEHLSPTRSNGLVNMVKQMKLCGLVLQEKEKHDG